jgi:hypothetical protein
MVRGGTRVAVSNKFCNTFQPLPGTIPRQNALHRKELFDQSRLELRWHRAAPRACSFGARLVRERFLQSSPIWPEAFADVTFIAIYLGNLKGTANDPSGGRIDRPGRSSALP